MSEEIECKVVDERETILEDGTKERRIYIMVPNEPKTKKRVRIVKKCGKHGEKRSWWRRVNDRFEEASPLTKTLITCAAGGAMTAGISCAASCVVGLAKGISDGMHGETAALPAGGEIVEVDPVII